MDIIGILLLLLLVFIVPWAHFRFAAQDREIGQLWSELRALRRDAGIAPARTAADGPPAPDPARAQAIAPPEPVPVPAPLPPAPAAAPVPPPAAAARSMPPRSTPPARPAAGLEFNLGTKLPVWIGAVALICAAFYFVRYSIDAGWFGPAERTALGALFGAALVFAGHRVAGRAALANYRRVSQALIGAGLVSLYVASYAAVSLYGLVPPAAGLAAMTAVTVMAVVMALRHGQAIAAFGVIGGALTPALTGSTDPQPVLLFSYLFVLYGFMLAMLARRGWWVLGACGMVAMTGWALLWAATQPASAAGTVAVLAFVVGLCAQALALTARYDAAAADGAARSLNMVAVIGGLLAVLVLADAAPLSVFGWGALQLITVACMVLTLVHPVHYRGVLGLKMLADMALLYVWAQQAPAAAALPVMTGMACVYIGLPLLGMRSGAQASLWAGVQAAGALALYVIAFLARGESADDRLWGAAALALAAGAIVMAGRARRGHAGDDTAREHVSSIYALAAAAFINMGLAVMLPVAALVTAVAALVPVCLWLDSRVAMPVMRLIATLVSVLFIMLNAGQLALFVTLLAGERAAELALDYPLLSLGVPAATFAAALLLERRQGREAGLLGHMLAGIAVLCGAGAAYYAVRGEGIGIDPATFVERGLFNAVLFGFAVFLARRGGGILRLWGMILFHTAMARLAIYDLLLFNPYFDGTQHVGALPLVNGVTLTYGLGTAMAAWAVYGPPGRGGRTPLAAFYKAAGFAILFAFVSLSVRQWHHGPVLADGTMPPLELYGYSAAWLLTGIALLAFGMRRDSKAARLGALGFIVLSIIKVFVFDAASLPDLYRVFSFLGLGLSLIGLSVFYTRFADRRRGGGGEGQP